MPPVAVQVRRLEVLGGDEVLSDGDDAAEGHDGDLRPLAGERIGGERFLKRAKAFVQKVDPGGSAGDDPVRTPVSLHDLAGVLARVGYNRIHRAGYVEKKDASYAWLRVFGEFACLETGIFGLLAHRDGTCKG